MVSVFLVSFASHDFHVSKARVEYSKGDATFQVMIYLFMDDIETALRQMQYEGLHIGTSIESAEVDRLVSDYINDKFRIIVNGKLLELTWVGKEAEDDFMGMWCYLESFPVEYPIDHIEIKNSILAEVFDDQQNMVYIDLADGRVYYALMDRNHLSKAFGSSYTD